LGQPVVRGLQQRANLIPALTWHPARTGAAGAFSLSTHARVTPDSVAAYAFGLSWRTPPSAFGRSARWPLEVIARLDTDGDLRRGAFVLGISLGGADRLGIVASTPGDVSKIDGLSVYGLATREPPAGRR
jgi:hypothetical protein